MKKLVILAVLIAGVTLVAPKVVQHNDSINLNRIQTDAKQTFPNDELIGCQWFVEQVNPVS